MCCVHRLLLPYEYHVKGVLMSFPPQLPPKHFQPVKYGKDEGDGPLAANRRLLPVALHQVGANLDPEHVTHDRCQKEKCPNVHICVLTPLLSSRSNYFEQKSTAVA